MNPKCSACNQDLPKQPLAIEDQSRNGVRVIVYHWPSGTVVVKDCSCMGYEMRAHDNPGCPRLLNAPRGG